MQPNEKFWKKCEGEQIANAYELEQLLGCGAFGGVFRAVQIANGRRLNKRVAVKLMLSGTIQQEELNFALDLPSHQNLVQHFAGNNVEIRGFPMFYLVMELADCSLADFVKKRGGKISSVEAKAILQRNQSLYARPSSPSGLWMTAITIGVISGGGGLIWQITRSVNSPLVISLPFSSKTATDFFNAGLIKSKSKDYKGAIADFNEAIRLNPNYSEAYNSRGAAKSDLGNTLGHKQGAIADFNESIRLNPINPEAYTNRGRVKYEVGDKQGVIVDSTEAIRLNSNLAEPYVNRGVAKDDLGDKQGAIADFTEAIRLSPNYALAYNNRGIAKSGLGDKRGEIADYDEAIRLNPNYALAYYNRGLIKKERGKKQEALADFRKASELHQQQGNTEFYNQSLDRIKELGG